MTAAHRNPTPVTPSGTALIVLFDGRCGFCTRCSEWIRARDRRARLLVRPYQTPGLLERLGVSRDCASRELIAVRRGGMLFGGAAACVQVLRQLDTPWRALAAGYDLPGVPWLAARGYEFVARNRGRLSRLGVVPACERPGAACGPDGAPA